MNETAPPPSNQQPKPPGNDMQRFFTWIRSLNVVRSDDRWVGGVAGGVARQLGLDPLLVRAVWGILILLSGLGIALYGVAWALLPDERDGRIHLETAIRGKFDNAMIGIGIAILIGISWAGGSLTLFTFGHSAFNPRIGLVASLVIIGLLIAWISRTHRPTPGPAPHSYAQANANTAWTSSAAPTDSSGGHDGTPPRYGADWNVPSPSDQAPWTPPPATPRTPAAGTATLAVTLGGILLSAGALLIAHHQGWLTGNLWLAVLGATVAICGISTIVLAIRGRRAGGVGGLAIAAIIVGATMLFWTANTAGMGNAHRTVFGNMTYKPTFVADAERGFIAVVGTTVVDLTGLPLSESSTVKIPLRALAGEFTVIVPSGTPVEADIRQGAGSIFWDLDSERQVGGVASQLNFQTSSVEDGALPKISFEVRMGAGELTIKES